MTRPTVDDLIEDVADIVQDTSQTSDDDKIIRLFNDAMYKLANNIFIPDLRTVGQISTIITPVNTNVVALPTNFHKNLTTCYNVTKKTHVQVYNSRFLIDRRLRDLNKAGSVIAVSKDGSNLYYQKIPTTVEVLQISYYKKPEDVSITDPTYLPDNIFSNLLINYACWRLYSKIEDGIEGEKVNTIYHKSEFNEAYAEAKMFFGPEEDEPYVPLKGDTILNNFNFDSLM